MNFIKPALLICYTLCSINAISQAGKWTNLLDKNLSQWQTYLSYRHTNDYKGEVPKDQQGNAIQPIGYNKNESNVFSVIEEKGVPVLRVSGEIYGCVFTKADYENYHFKLQVKWGEKKWVPRLEKLKDAGICYHSQGECGKDYWRAWMLSQEFQIMEGHMGDYWNIANAAIDVRALIPEGNMNPVASHKQPFLPIGTGTAIAGFCLRTIDNETPNNDWTTLELICFNGKSLHIINGKVVMVLANSRYHEGGKDVPLTKGKIQLQSEAAEIFYKAIQIKTLDKLPAGYESYFK
jgi:hypothetical protein